MISSLRSNEFAVLNVSRGTRLAEEVEVADTRPSRARGLLGRHALPDGQGLLILPSSSVHTFFMRFPIDILFVDKKGKVLKAARSVHPYRVVTAHWRAYYVLELPSGAIGRTNTSAGDRLKFATRDGTWADGGDQRPATS
jgi:uncharacterized membrane protein (UPF0127 family)